MSNYTFISFNTRKMADQKTIKSYLNHRYRTTIFDDNFKMDEESIVRTMLYCFALNVLFPDGGYEVISDVSERAAEKIAKKSKIRFDRGENFYIIESHEPTYITKLGNLNYGLEFTNKPRQGFEPYPYGYGSWCK